jgi:hypothetical protein
MLPTAPQAIVPITSGPGGFNRNGGGLVDEHKIAPIRDPQASILANMEFMSTSMCID